MPKISYYTDCLGLSLAVLAKFNKAGLLFWGQNISLLVEQESKIGLILGCIFLIACAHCVWVFKLLTPTSYV